MVRFPRAWATLPGRTRTVCPPLPSFAFIPRSPRSPSIPSRSGSPLPTLRKRGQPSDPHSDLKGRPRASITPSRPPGHFPKKTASFWVAAGAWGRRRSRQLSGRLSKRAGHLCLSLSAKPSCFGGGFVGVLVWGGGAMYCSKGNDAIQSSCLGLSNCFFFLLFFLIPSPWTFLPCV